MTHEVQTALDTAKQALFFLNKALCTLSTSKPNDLLATLQCAKNTPDQLDTIRFIYRTVNSCIDEASTIRDNLLNLEVYNLSTYTPPIPPTTTTPATLPQTLPPDPHDIEDLDDSISPGERD